MMRIILPLILLFFIQSEAQRPAAGPQASIVEGLRIDSPQVFVAWGSDVSSITGFANVKVNEMKHGVTLVQWQTARLFGLPVDSMYLHFLTKSKVQQPGLHRIFLYFDQKYMAQLKMVFEQMLGEPEKADDDGRFVLLVWHAQHLNVLISNKKYLEGSKDIGVFIELPYYL